MSTLKNLLFDCCLSVCHAREKDYLNEIALIKESLETISGNDEEGSDSQRENLLENLTKNNQRLMDVRNQITTLKNINPNISHTVAKLGSLVETNTGKYFLSVSVGKIVLEEKTYYAVSEHSPIGLVLMNGSSGQQTVFNNARLQIISVV
jgi:transcription elongation GreA/GreB family factor